ncbi:MAG: DNA helicase [Rhizobiaceae bacterium]|nr:DNA helicase [Rhizobiaceae bacterium]
MKLDTPIYNLKRKAKHLARATNIPFHKALDNIAVERGFKSWSHLSSIEQQERAAISLMKNLNAGDFLLLGARPQQGKTMLALHVLVRAVKSGMNGFFFSLEYTSGEVWKRLAGFGMERSFDGGELVVDTYDSICAEYICKRLKDCSGPTLVVIDYLQLLDQRREHDELQTQVGQLSRVAKELGVIIIALSQIDRSFDPTTQSVPSAENIRLPNPVDLGLFSKACFVHDGRTLVVTNP